MQRQYKIKIAGKTRGDLTLPKDYILVASKETKENKTFTLEIFLCKSLSADRLRDRWEFIPNSDISYPYDPATDDAKTTNAIYKNTLEKDLDVWVGSGNWVKI